MNLDKDSIAILLYGEYRTFDVVNTFWDFKENQNIDFYFSTWNFSYQGNDELKIDYKEKITTNSFTKYFKENIPFLNIMDLETEMGMYNCKHEKYIKYHEKAVPIHLRHFLEMMDTTSYDYIVLTRPDVFFDLNNLHKLSLEENEIGVDSSLTNDIIHDLFVCGRGNIMYEFIRKAKNYNQWGHECLKDFYDNKTFKFKSVNASSVIVRPNCRNVDNLRYDKIMKLKDEFNKEKTNFEIQKHFIKKLI
tara:strand:- start:767 stop:1510 length:744 start_codon:yes stop_codon:yes gene_type:complete